MTQPQPPPKLPTAAEVELLTGPDYDPAVYGQHGGWFWAMHQLPSGQTEGHVLPINDLRQHELDEACWCAPSPRDQGDFVVFTHQSKDGRERAEQGVKQ